MLRKKVISFFLTAAIILTLIATPVTASVYEQEFATLSEALMAVSAESISSEPLGLVTEALTLPVTAGSADVSIEWSSSDESVIGNDGTVCRDLSEFKTAVLTATVTDGTNEEKVTHNISVAPLTVNKFKETTFADIDAEPDTALAAGTYSGFINTTGNNFTMFRKSNNDSYIESDFQSVAGTLTSYVSMSGHKHHTLYYYVNLKNGDGAITNGLNLRIVVKNSANNFVTTTAETIAYVTGSKIQIRNSTGTKNLDVGNLASGDFTPVMFKFDLVNNQIYAKMGEGDWVGPGLMLRNAANYSYTEGDWIERVVFMRGSGSTSEQHLLITEQAAYVENDVSELVAKLTDSEKINFFKSRITTGSTTAENPITITSDLDLDGGYEGYDLEKCGVSINWDSSNSDIIANDGTVNTGLAAQTVNMTATITAGDESETVSFPFIVVQGGTNPISTLKPSVKDIDIYSASDFETEDNRITLQNSSYEKDPDVSHGTVLKVVNDADTGLNAYTTAFFSQCPLTARYFINFDMKYARTDVENYPNSIGGFDFYGLGGKKFASIYLNFNDRKIRVISTRPNSTFDGIDSEVNSRYNFNMPDSVTEGNWSTFTIDYNVISQTYQIYINGELINDIPLIVFNADDTSTVHPIRGIGLYTFAFGELSFDNLSMRYQTDSDAVIANAGLNAALITYASEELHSALVATDTFATSGPLTRAVVKDDYINNPGLYNMSGGAALSYEIDSSPSTGINPTLMGKHSFKITSTYNTATETKTVTRKIAPVSIERVIKTGNSISKVILNGDYTGKKLYLASYTDDGLSDIGIYDAQQIIETNINVKNIDAVKVFLFNGTLATETFSYSIAY